MRRSLLFLIIIVIIILGASLGYWLKFQNLFIKEEISMPEKNLEGKKIALVIAFRDFRDVEYFIPRDILSGAGVEIVTVSSRTGTAIGADGGEVQVDLSLDEVRIENFDALAFMGGPGMAKNLEKEAFHRIVQDTVEADKVLGAICIAPVLLAKATVLEGKKATVWSSPLDRSPIRILEESGAEYQDQKVVIDDKIVTANGPGAAKEFGEALVKVLTRK